MVQPTSNIVWQFLIKVDIQSPYDLATLIQDIYPKGIKTYVYAVTFIEIYVAALFTVAPNRKQTEFLSTIEWVRISCCICKMEYDSPTKRKNMKSQK